MYVNKFACITRSAHAHRLLFECCSQSEEQFISVFVYVLLFVCFYWDERRYIPWKFINHVLQIYESFRVEIFATNKQKRNCHTMDNVRMYYAYFSMANGEFASKSKWMRVWSHELRASRDRHVLVRAHCRRRCGHAKILKNLFAYEEYNFDLFSE